MIETVIKVGGSLGRTRQLIGLMDRIAQLGPKHKVLIVPGGGAFAEAIREYDRRFGLDRDASHWMAILAMDQYGHLLSSLLPNGELVQGLAQARRVLSAGRVPVLLTYDLLYQADELPRSWDVTSDSIAAWIAGLAGAGQLVLLKSLDGLFEDDREGRGDPVLLKEAALDRLARGDCVDPYFQTVLTDRRLKVWIINGEYPERLARLLETGSSLGTRLTWPGL